MSELSPGIETDGRDQDAGGRGVPARRWGAGLYERARAGWLGVAATFEREIEAGRGFLWLPVLFGAGIVGYFALPREPWLPAMAVVTAVLVVAAWASRRRVVLFRVMLVVTFVFAGAAWMTLRTSVVASPRLAREQTVEVSGWVAAREAAARGGARLVVAVERIAGLAKARTPARVQITVLSGADAIAVGDALSVLARLRPPGGPVMPGGYDFGRADYYEGIGAVGFAYGAAKPDDLGPAPFGIRLRKPLADLRETIRRRILAVLPGDTGEIAAALVMGDRRGVSDATQETMRQSGLGHVLAISGLHMALVAGSMFWLLRALFALSPRLALTRPIRKWAAGGALFVGAVYLAVSGANVATQRAYIMLAVILCAVLLDRRAITVRNVAIAALVVLVIAPESVLTASFQMSFAATLALVAGYEALRLRADRAPGLMAADGRGLAGRMWLAASGLFVTSLIGGLATTPFAVYHFHRAAPLALLANLAAMPVVAIVVMPAALLAVLLMPFGLEALALTPMGWGIDWMVTVGAVVARWSEGWGGVPAMPAAALVLTVVGFLWLALWRERWRLAGLVPIALAVPLTLAAERPDILIDAGGETVAARGVDGRLSIVNPKANRFAAEYWLRADADPREVADAAAVAPCDEAGCVALLADGVRLAVGKTPAALEDDCRLSAIVVSRFAAPSWCGKAATVIDRRALESGGAHALFRIPADETGASHYRIETAYPAGPRRPFMPVAQ